MTQRFGKFIPKQKLGAGGMGEVWKAWDSAIGRWVALKFVLQADEESIARLLREATLAARLNHPNIGAVYETGRIDGRPYIAMQFIEGASPRPRLAPRRAAKLVRDAALAVQYAHEQGIIHRDLKPENLMVGPRDRVFVLDFGLARPTEGRSELSQSGMIVGTPDYMSPEQAAGETLDGRTDIWALGVTLHVLVSGRRPFRGAALLATLQNIAEQDAPRLPELDTDLQSIVQRCLEKEAVRRYASAADLAADLTRWLEGEAIAASSHGLSRALRKLKKRRTPLLIAGASLAAIAVAFAFLIPKWNAERARTEAESGETQRVEQRRVALREVNQIWGRLLGAREWIRQSFRTPEEIRAEFQAAGRDLDAFIERNPSVPQARFVRGWSRMYLGDFRGAETDLTKATTLEPGFTAARILLGQVLLEAYIQGLYSPAPEDLVLSDISPLLERATRELSRVSNAEGLARWGLAESSEEEAARVTAGALKANYVGGDTAGAIERLRSAHAKSPSESFARWLAMLDSKSGKSHEWWSEAVRIGPNSLIVHFDRGMSRAHEGDLEGAAADFEFALRGRPDWVDALSNRGSVLFITDKLAEALTCFDAAIRLSPDSAALHLNRGLVHDNLNHLDLARADFDRALQLQPIYPDAQSMRGRIRLRQGDLAGALRDAEAAAAAGPGRWRVLENLGEISEATGDWKKASEALARSLELKPDNAVVLRKLAGVIFHLGDFQRSLELCDRSLKLDPTSALAHMNRGAALCALGDMAGGLASFGRAIERDPKLADPHLNRALASFRMGDFDGAIADARAVLALNQKNAKAWMYLGMATGGKGHLKEALEMLDRAVELEPRSPAILITRGEIRWRNSDARGGQEDFTKAISLDPNCADAYGNRAKGHCELKEYREAVADCTRGLESCPADPSLHMLRGSAREALQDGEGALADYEAAVRLSPPNWPPRKEVQAAIEELRKLLGK